MTYKEAQELYKKKFGKMAKTCWIADILNSHGKTKSKAWNRKGDLRMYPCPENIRTNLEKVLKELKMI